MSVLFRSITVLQFPLLLGVLVGLIFCIIWKGNAREVATTKGKGEKYRRKKIERPQEVCLKSCLGWGLKRGKGESISLALGKKERKSQFLHQG